MKKRSVSKFNREKRECVVIRTSSFNLPRVCVCVPKCICVFLFNGALGNLGGGYQCG